MERGITLSSRCRGRFRGARFAGPENAFRRGPAPTGCRGLHQQRSARGRYFFQGRLCSLPGRSPDGLFGGLQVSPCERRNLRMGCGLSQESPGAGPNEIPACPHCSRAAAAVVFPHLGSVTRGGCSATGNGMLREEARQGESPADGKALPAARSRLLRSCPQVGDFRPLVRCPASGHSPQPQPGKISGAFRGVPRRGHRAYRVRSRGSAAPAKQSRLSRRRRKEIDRLPALHTRHRRSSCRRTRANQVEAR